MTTATTHIDHEKFCLPRPGADEPRVESFTVPRTGPDGVTRIGQARVTRCIECGSQSVEG